MAERPFDAFLDARGLACPMPLVKARQALMVLDRGATVCVVATDPASEADFESFCEATGHKLLKSERSDNLFIFVLEKT